MGTKGPRGQLTAVDLTERMSSGVGLRTKGGLTVADLSTTECRQPTLTHLGAHFFWAALPGSAVVSAGEVAMFLHGSAGEVTAFGRS